MNINQDIKTITMMNPLRSFIRFSKFCGSLQAIGEMETEDPVRFRKVGKLILSGRYVPQNENQEMLVRAYRYVIKDKYNGKL